MEDTNIEWADDTANFWEGCTQVSPACDFCYAMKRAARYRFLKDGTLNPNGVDWNGPPKKVAAGLKQLRRSNAIGVAQGRPRLVFINSLSDTFDNNVPPEWRRELFDAIKAAPHVLALLLTKRIGNVVKMALDAGGLPGNVAVGATFCNQEEIDRDEGKLRAVSALLKVRTFASIEPLLGPIRLPVALMHTLDAVIVGGESGPDARPMHPAWVRSLRDQCASASVAFDFKQWGEWRPAATGEEYDTSNGRAQDVPCFIIAKDGTVHCFHNDQTQGGAVVRRVGKKRAGRLLDGRTHDGFRAAMADEIAADLPHG